MNEHQKARKMLEAYKAEEQGIKNTALVLAFLILTIALPAALYLSMPH